METDNDNKSSGGKIALLILVIICSSFIVYFTVMSMLGPSRRLAEMKKEYSSEQSDNKKEKDKGKEKQDSRNFTDSAYLRLIKERALLQSRLIMAETDSIYLTINLADSSMNLEISGVVVHKSKMSSYKASKILTHGNENIIFEMLSTPLTISSDIATIKKEPVMVKMAPKDTSEYKPDIMPDTSITEPVSYILEMTNGTRIFVYQQEEEKPADRMAIFRFDLNDRLRQTWKALKRVAVFKVPEYDLYIKIKLPRADAKIIYRAIPKKGQISVFL
ncbi:MAG: hypothetical protein IPN67_10685 [Bacteroidales bacterium]|nr:hypothetical protein [Bacteroidales bacterium]